IADFATRRNESARGLFLLLRTRRIAGGYQRRWTLETAIASQLPEAPGGPSRQRRYSGEIRYRQNHRTGTLRFEAGYLGIPQCCLETSGHCQTPVVLCGRGAV